MTQEEKYLKEKQKLEALKDKAKIGSANIPNGYMTGAEFEYSVKSELLEFYYKNGLL